MKVGAGLARGVASIVLATLLSSCTSGTGSAEREPDIGPIKTITSGSEVTLPLDAYRFTQKEYITVRRAAWRLVRDCVRRFGGDYTLPNAMVVADVPRLEHDNARRYGLFDAASATARGYNLPAEELPPDREKGGGWNPSDTEKMLVRGVAAGSANIPMDTQGKPLPSGGCSGEADRMLAQGAAQPADDSLADRLSVESHQRSEADSRVREAVQKWAECMKRSGYSYTSIWEPNDKKWPDPAGNEEIATAKADVACKAETNLVGVWMAVELAYQNRAIEQHAQELTALQAYVRAASRNAASIVGGA
jgi:hypothetical protein